MIQLKEEQEREKRLRKEAVVSVLYMSYHGKTLNMCLWMFLLQQWWFSLSVSCGVVTSELQCNSCLCDFPGQPMPGQKARLQSRLPFPLSMTLKLPGRLPGSSPPISTNQVTLKNKLSYT